MRESLLVGRDPTCFHVRSMHGKENLQPYRVREKLLRSFLSKHTARFELALRDVSPAYTPLKAGSSAIELCVHLPYSLLNRPRGE